MSARRAAKKTAKPKTTKPKGTPKAVADTVAKEPFDFWTQPAVIVPNNFKFKSLSCWSLNVAVGCCHGCSFCYVPETSAGKQAEALRDYGVNDPDAEWGSYSLLRPWDEKAFLASLKRAEDTPVNDLKRDGNRAVMLCSTTDPYQTFRANDPAKQKQLQQASRKLIQSALEAILDKSTINVRILTRSPLAEKDFELFKRFGNRLTFGMSLPTLNEDLIKIYEPKAPGVRVRLKTLKAAKEAGLHVFVAMAPTFPECDGADIRATLTAIKELNPITIFHEPINIRAENVKRIETYAKSINKTVKSEVLADRDAWRKYSIESLMMVERVATELGLGDHLHLWPDKDLKSKANFLAMRRELLLRNNPDSQLTTYQMKRFRDENEAAYEDFKKWIDTWHSRISEWPEE